MRSSTRAMSASSGLGFASISHRSSLSSFFVAFGLPFLRISVTAGLPGVAMVTACTSSGEPRHV